ncbi:MAG: ArsA-related P-loop ATPase, partial [bacterium]
TGKGGVGKTTVAAALAQQLAAARRRVLLVETAADRSVAALFGAATLGVEPVLLADRLSGVRIETHALVEAYFRRLLRLPFLARRLFASGTFQAVTAAAPGVTEFVILDHLLQWTEPARFTRRAPFDAVIVDGPASGHAVRLLRTPRQLGRLVPRGPVSTSIGRLQALVEDHTRTRVVLVAIPDEMAVTEALETRAALARLHVRLAPPVLNRVWPRRFTAAEEATVTAASAAPRRGRRKGDDVRRPGDPERDPLLQAARLAIAGRREAERHLTALKRAFGAAPIALGEQAGHAVDSAVLALFGASLDAAAEG